MIDKLPLQTTNITTQNIEAIAALFPNCITETTNTIGELRRTIDFDLLKQELSTDIIDGFKERYRLEWAGKREAIVTANIPTTKTLRPIIADSVNFDTTQNLYIEGDNLEVLKLLQESYLGKIKMIDIDPPYNTGNDFVYKDNFTQDKAEYEQDNAIKDEYNQRLQTNPETSGRYHSAWLSMMYPRLKLARNLLTDDGVIFIHIDDNEVHNLRKVCDEVFGEGNFVASVPRVAKRTSDKGTHFRPTKDYILVFAKNILNLEEFGIPKKIVESDYTFTDEKGRKYKQSGASLFQPSLDSRPNQRYYIEAPDGSLIIPPGNVFPDKKEDACKVKPESNSDKVWRWSVESYKVQKHLLIFTKGSSQNPLLDENGNQSKWNIYPKVFLDEDVEATLHPEDIIYDFPNSQGTKEILNLDIPFSFAKPSNLIKYLISLVKNSDIILDFFSGSATTAHAVMQLNAEDSGNRKFIMVQVPEATDPKSEAYKAGYKNICEIGKERIRRAANKIQEEQTAKQQIAAGQLGFENENSLSLDLGFRVYRVDSSNMQDVYYKPQDFKQENLDLFASNIKPDRTAEDLLAQVMLSWGLPLHYKIATLTIQGKQVFKVEENSLFACFDNGIDEAFAKEIATYQPLRIVFKDDSFTNDTAKENVKQLLKQLSPNIEMKVI